MVRPKPAGLAAEQLAALQALVDAGADACAHSRGKLAMRRLQQAVDQGRAALQVLREIHAPAGYIAHELNTPGMSRCERCCAASDDALCEQLPCMPDTRADGRWVYFTNEGLDQAPIFQPNQGRT